MGLDAYLEDEFGGELDLFIDDGGVLAAAIPGGDPAYPMLRYVDVEGVTAFNRLQLAVVIPELEKLSETAPPDTKHALSFLATRPEVEPGRIGLLGASFGAAVAVYTAGVDPRVAACISAGGWGDGEL